MACTHERIRCRHNADRKTQKNKGERMSYFLTGLICFSAGALFGVFIICALSLAKQTDESI